VTRVGIRIDPYANDAGHLGVSLINVAELLIPCLDAVEARSVVEVGAYAGDLTGLLLEWAAGSGARVVAIDPSPQKELVALDERRSDLELIRDTSLRALQRVEPADAVVIDGDHNYYTVSEELRLIAERATGATLPLLMLHDVGWPHGRRDDYFAPELIPEECRQPTSEGGGLLPGDPGIREDGMPYPWPAVREGGPRNGVLSAIEDFVSERAGLRLAVVPVFFGLGVVWESDAPWADAVAEILEGWDRNPLLERLEANRVFHLANARFQRGRVLSAGERATRKDELLGRLLNSRTLALAEWISRLRQRGEPTLSREEVRRALSE
jgi:SAM-dependent methyltransferase